MAVKTTKFDGAVSVGDDLTIGGNVTVQGSETIGHNLRVEGWLDARNVKGANKGVFENSEDLIEAYPNPEPGWFAGVGTKTPFGLWLVMEKTDGTYEWYHPTNGQMEITADLAYYDGKIAELNERLGTVSQKVSDLDDTAVRVRVGSDGTATIVT